MLKRVVITNYRGESIEYRIGDVMVRPDNDPSWVSMEQSGLLITDISGLGPVKANINMTELTTTDGGIYNSARLSTRNIVIKARFMHASSIEEARLLSYKYFPIKKKLKFYIETDNRKAEVEGYVESNEPDIFDEECGCQISVLCESAFFNAAGEGAEQIIKFSSTEPLFKFPLVNGDSSASTSLQYSNNIFYIGPGDRTVGEEIEFYSVKVPLTSEQILLDSFQLAVKLSDVINISTFNASVYFNSQTNLGVIADTTEKTITIGANRKGNVDLEPVSDIIVVDGNGVSVGSIEITNCHLEITNGTINSQNNTYTCSGKITFSYHGNLDEEQYMFGIATAYNENASAKSILFRNPEIASGIKMGEIFNKRDSVVTYKGDSETGFILKVHFYGNVGKLSIYCTDTDQKITLDPTKLPLIPDLTGVEPNFINGDEVDICTVTGKKTIKLLREGKEYNVLNILDKNSDWFVIGKGDNRFVYETTTELESQYVELTIVANVIYEGV